MRVNEYIASETLRQSGTVREALGMREAYDYLLGREYITEAGILHMASLLNGSHYWRKVPVVFDNGGTAAAAENIPRLMGLWVEAVGFDMTALADEQANMFAKEFLDIHPFTDGNGRIASLLWNWLRGSLTDPEPLPYFYGDSPHAETLP